MRKFAAFLVALLFAVPAFSQMGGDIMYIYLKKGVWKCITVADVDSVTFASPVDAPIDRSPAEAIDLGLSVKWASCNVGASSPEDYGGYYAWGETEEKSDYSWETYKWCNGSVDLIKYNDMCGENYDGRTTLELSDDVAYVKWGGHWRMPTYDEFKELSDKCSWISTTVNDVPGYKVTGPNGNSIFLPAAGERYGTRVDDRGSYGSYWSASLGGGDNDAYNMNYYINSWLDLSGSNPTLGCSVRPIHSPQSDTMYIHFNDGSMQCIAVANVDSISFDNLPDHSPIEAIDLGLSVKWASCNIGATSPEEYGGYYAWGETEEKSEYSSETYKWCIGYEFIKYNDSEEYSEYYDGKTILEPSDDVAHVKWGGSWRMPTKYEIGELYAKCRWSWTSINGIYGYTVTGPNGNSIFLPAAGYYDGAKGYSIGSIGNYWSASLMDDNDCYSVFINLTNKEYGWDALGYRGGGLSVRAVCN